MEKIILVRTAYCLVEAHLNSTEKKSSPAEGRKLQILKIYLLDPIQSGGRSCTVIG